MCASTQFNVSLLCQSEHSYSSRLMFDYRSFCAQATHRDHVGFSFKGWPKQLLVFSLASLLLFAWFQESFSSERLFLALPFVLPIAHTAVLDRKVSLRRNASPNCSHLEVACLDGIFRRSVGNSRGKDSIRLASPDANGQLIGRHWPRTHSYSCPKLQ